LPARSVNVSGAALPMKGATNRLARTDWKLQLDNLLTLPTLLGLREQKTFELARPQFAWT